MQATPAAQFQKNKWPNQKMGQRTKQTLFLSPLHKCWLQDFLLNTLYPKLWWWRRLLKVPWTARRSSQSILKEISPRCSLEGLMLKLKHQCFGHLMWRADSFEKTLMLGKIEGGRRRGWQRMRWLDGIMGSLDMSLSKLNWTLNFISECVFWRTQRRTYLLIRKVWCISVLRFPINLSYFSLLSRWGSHRSRSWGKDTGIGI